jgi:DNA end-binding protein Ku
VRAPQTRDNRIGYLRLFPRVPGRDTSSTPTIVRGYKSGDGYIEITKQDLEGDPSKAIQVESTRTTNVDHFVSRDEIDDLYINRPYLRRARRRGPAVSG